jgi:hypothetical protein
MYWGSLVRDHTCIGHTCDKRQTTFHCGGGLQCCHAGIESLSDTRQTSQPCIQSIQSIQSGGTGWHCSPALLLAQTVCARTSHRCPQQLACVGAPCLAIASTECAYIPTWRHRYPARETEPFTFQRGDSIASPPRSQAKPVQA